MLPEPFIFIDTCSLLDSCWVRSSKSGVEQFSFSKQKEQRFWEQEFKSLAAIGKVILPKRNYDELKKHAKNTSKPGLARRSEYILKKLEKLIKDGSIEIVGDANDPFADAILLSVALKFRTQRHLLFVTQDKALARDLEAISRFESVNSHYDLKVRTISARGEIVRIQLHNNSSTNHSNASNHASAAIGSPPDKTNGLLAVEPQAKGWWER